MGRNIGSHSQFGVGSQLYDQRVAYGVLDRLYDLHSFYCNRYGSGIHSYEYGHDDAAAHDDFHAFQDSTVCTGRRMGIDHRAAGTDVLLTGEMR